MNKRLLSLLLAAVMLLVLVPVEVFADTVPVTYLDYVSGAFKDEECATYTSMTDGTSWSDGWYVVDADVTIGNRVTVSGDVHLILMNGKSLTVNKGICVSEGNSLTIYGQSGGTGRLTVQAVDTNNAGIGGYNREPGGNITINDGIINVTGGDHAAGIGGGYKGSGGTTTIHGGTVTATGGGFAAGIGGGDGKSSGTITITGGIITATGGNYGAAGIGGGNHGINDAIEITGGMITATGNGGGAGVGSGCITNDDLPVTPSDMLIENAMIVAKTLESEAGVSIGAGIDPSGNCVKKENCIVFEESTYRSEDRQPTSAVVGSPTLSGNVTIPAGKTITIPAGQTVTVAPGATLTNNGTVTVESGAELTNNGTVTVASGAELKNNGTVTVASGAALTNNGTVSVASGATLTNNGTVTVESSATLNNSGAMTVAPGATLTNNGTVQNDGAIQNNGTIDGTIEGTSPQVPAPSVPSGPSQIFFTTISGAGETWKPGTQSGYTASFSAPLEDFTGLRLDGNPVPDGSFTAASGSTVITLKPGYLATLPAGEHTLEALFTSGYGQVIFTVAEGKKVNPETGGGTLETGDAIETGKIEFNAAAPLEKPVDSAPEAAPAAESANVLLPVLLVVLALAAGTGFWLWKRKEN